jgi:hypothetical protein
MTDDPDMCEEYDFSGGERGKYAKQFAEGSIVVTLDPDLVEFFPTTASMNDALRHLAAVIQSQKRNTGESSPTD